MKVSTIACVGSVAASLLQVFTLFQLAELFRLALGTVGVRLPDPSVTALWVIDVLLWAFVFTTLLACAVEWRLKSEATKVTIHMANVIAWMALSSWCHYALSLVFVGRK